MPFLIPKNTGFINTFVVIFKNAVAMLSKKITLLKNLSFILITLLLLSACSTTNSFKKDKAIFDSSRILSSFKSGGDLNDSYFIIKENNFVEFYKTLFDSVKNTSYPGKYEMSGDTLHLKFYNKKAYETLGNKALINNNQKEIIFFNVYPGVKTRLIMD